MDSLIEQAEQLKAQIITPAHPDREGRTDLHRRILNNVAFKMNAEQILAESQIAAALADSLDQFTSAQLASLFNFINKSGLNEPDVAKKYFGWYVTHSNKLSDFQKTEVIRFLLKTIPNLVPLDLIEDDLYRVKIADPWLFAEVLSKKDVFKAGAFVKYLMKNGQYSTADFANLLTNWLAKYSEETKVIELISSLLLLSRDKETQEYFQSEIEELGHEVVFESLPSPEILVGHEYLSNEVLKVAKRTISLAMRDGFTGFMVNVQKQNSQNVQKQNQGEAYAYQ